MSLASKVKPGGHVSAWIYGAENNEWITRLVNPVREKFTSRIDQRVLLQLSKLPAACLYLATKLVYGPLNRNGSSLAKHLFYNDYLSAISNFRLARAAHDRFRSSGGADCVLHFARGV